MPLDQDETGLLSTIVRRAPSPPPSRPRVTHLRPSSLGTNRIAGPTTVSRRDGPLRPQPTQLSFNRALATSAHARGLSVGLKNDLDQVGDLVATFDWALNEECFTYGACDLLRPFIAAGKPVLNVEYTMTPDQLCPQAKALGFSSLVKHLNLDAYRVACP